jgi:hypothetical protein
MTTVTWPWLPVESLEAIIKADEMAVIEQDILRSWGEKDKLSIFSEAWLLPLSSLNAMASMFTALLQPCQAPHLSPK